MRTGDRRGGERAGIRGSECHRHTGNDGGGGVARMLCVRVKIDTKINPWE